jgi:hypothetical protein
MPLVFQIVLCRPCIELYMDGERLLFRPTGKWEESCRATNAPSYAHYNSHFTADMFSTHRPIHVQLQMLPAEIVNGTPAIVSVITLQSIIQALNELDDAKRLYNELCIRSFVCC